MRVAFDARLASRGLGVAVYVRRLGEQLAARAGIELVWLGPEDLAPVGTAEVDDVTSWPYPVLETRFGRRRVGGHNPDIMHFTGNTGWPRRSRLPVVLTVHDLIFMRTAARGRSWRQRVGHPYARWNVRRSVEAARAVATVSQATADDVTRTLRPSRSPRAIPSGVDLPSVLHGARLERGDHVLAFGGRDPRKGTADVLAAWRAARPEGLRLRVLAGGGLPPGWLDDASPEIKAGEIEVLDYLAREELWQQLATARGLLYPSRDEGFGLPVLEAMAAGTPVACGLAPATLEVGGDAVIALDEADPLGSLTAVIRRIDADDEALQELAARARARAASFSWSEAAGRYAELYTEVA